MNHIIIKIVFFLIPLATALSLEIDTSTNFTNLYFDPNRSPDSSGKTFKGNDLFWCIDFIIKSDLQDNVKLNAGFSTDPILQRRLFSELSMDWNDFNISFTPFLGTFNTWEKWFTPGIDASLKYSLPGFGFLQGGFSSTFSPLSKIGDYYSGSEFGKIGIFLENGIVSFLVENKLLTKRQTQSLDTTNEITKYYLDSEIFIKNFPFKFNIGTGYQQLNRSYNADSQQQTTLHSLILGCGYSWDVSKDIITYGQLQTAVATMGWNDVIYSVPDTGLLFFSKIGVKYRF